MKLQAVEYIVTWQWRAEVGRRGSYVNRYDATSATRAISKHYKTLQDEYVFTRNDVVIISVIPGPMFEGVTR